MNYLFLLLMSTFLTNCSMAQSASMAERLIFVEEGDAKELLTKEDAFTESWSPFDIDSRMQKPGSSKEELFTLIENEVRPWEEDEKDVLMNAVKEIDIILATEGYRLPLPENIKLIKTTMEEEGGAGAYTRSDYIVFGEQITTMDKESIKQIFLHELFHVLSRKNPAFKEDIYAVFGFKIINHIDYPASIKGLRITNPDAPQTDHYIELDYNEEKIKCMMVLYADRPYDSGSFFEYLNIGFLKLSGDDTMKPILEDGEPVIYTMNEVQNYFEQVGQNTQYIIHPEEISADNFSYAILEKEGLSHPELVEELRGLLIKK